MYSDVCDLQEVLIFFPPCLVSHPQPSVLIVSYIESAKAAAQFGFYQKAEWKPDDSMIAVAVSSPVCCEKVLLLCDACWERRNLKKGVQKNMVHKHSTLTLTAVVSLLINLFPV